MVRDSSNVQQNKLLDKLKSKPSHLKHVGYNFTALQAKKEHVTRMGDDAFYFDHDMLTRIILDDYDMMGKKELLMCPASYN